MNEGGVRGPDLLTFSKAINKNFPDTRTTQRTSLSPLDGTTKRMKGYQGNLYQLHIKWIRVIANYLLQHTTMTTELATLRPTWKNGLC